MPHNPCSSNRHERVPTRLQQFFNEQGLNCEVHLAKDVALLSESGMQDLGAGKLTDVSGSLVDPFVTSQIRYSHLGRVAPHQLLGRRRNCAEIGYSLLDAISTSGGWDEAAAEVAHSVIAECRGGSYSRTMFRSRR